MYGAGHATIALRLASHQHAFCASLVAWPGEFCDNGKRYRHGLVEVAMLSRYAAACRPAQDWPPAPSPAARSSAPAGKAPAALNGVNALGAPTLHGKRSAPAGQAAAKVAAVGQR